MELLFSFILVLFEDIEISLALAIRARREIHHRLHLDYFSCTLKSPTLSHTWLVKYSILTYSLYNQ